MIRISVKNFDSRQLNLLGEYSKDRLTAIRDRKFEDSKCLVIGCGRDQSHDWHNLCGKHFVRPRDADPSEPVCPECGFKYEDPWSGDICRDCGTDMVVEDRYCMICGRCIDAGFSGKCTDNFLIGDHCFADLIYDKKPSYWTEEIERAIRG